MRRINHFIVFCCLFFGISCAEKQYKITQIEGSCIEMDSTWDKNADPKLIELVNFYKNKLNADINSKIGVAARTLTKDYPQGLLSNFTADAIQDFGEKEWGNIDFAIMNNGGIRAPLNQGVITVGNMFEIYSFDNQLILLELPGKAVNELFSFLAVNGGEALSKGIRFVIKDRKIKTLFISNQPVDENKIYRVVTIDFLAEGNDGMNALKKANKRTDSDKFLRDIMIDLIKERSESGELIDATLDDRILIDP